MSQTVENVPYRNVEEYFKKFMGPNPDADDFQTCPQTAYICAKKSDRQTHVKH